MTPTVEAIEQDYIKGYALPFQKQQHPRTEYIYNRITFTLHIATKREDLQISPKYHLDL